jgi:hypothetical protein
MNHKKRKDNSSGYTGVSFHKIKRKWEAYIGSEKGIISLGSFNSFSDAKIARINASKKFHGEFARFV